jgi:REG-2-like HAD superfamily hydrolase
MALPFLFFDVGGTLLHFRPSFVDVVVATCSSLGVVSDRARASDAVQRALAEAGRGPDPVDTAKGRRWWYTLFGTLLLELGHVDRSGDLVDELWKRHQAGDWLTPAPDTISTLDILADAGFRMGVVSNWDDTLEAILERRGLLGYFEIVVASASVGVAKPHPGIFSYAMARVGVSPRQGVHVGDDTLADVEGAIGVGLTPVFLGSRWSLDGVANVLRISTLGELPDVLASTRHMSEHSSHV